MAYGDLSVSPGEGDGNTRAAHRADSAGTTLCHCRYRPSAVSVLRPFKTLPDVQSMLLLANLFGTTIDELVRGDVDEMREMVEKNERRTRTFAVALAVVEVVVVTRSPTWSRCCACCSRCWRWRSRWPCYWRGAGGVTKRREAPMSSHSLLSSSQSIALTTWMPSSVVPRPNRSRVITRRGNASVMARRGLSSRSRVARSSMVAQTWT